MVVFKAAKGLKFWMKVEQIQLTKSPLYIYIYRERERERERNNFNMVLA
jgi:hypothetical protein